MYEKQMKSLDLYSLEKNRLGGGLMAAYSFVRGAEEQLLLSSL